ncbi:MAG TPA: XdhC family protein [Polyangia bacterium]
MTELQAVIAAARERRAAGQPFLIATVVTVRGSSYRRPGARLLIAGDRWITGSVSGGCLEGDLLRRGWWHTGAAPSAVVTYDSTADEEDPGWGVGFGCNGVVDVLLEKVDAETRNGAAIDCLLDLGARTAPCAVVTVFRSPLATLPIGSRSVVEQDGTIGATSCPATGEAGRVVDAFVREARKLLGSRALAETMTVGTGSSTVEALIEVVVPPPSLFVCGGGRDAAPVAALARLLGWNVAVYEPRPRPALVARFEGAHRLITGAPRALGEAVARAPRPLAVVMSHDFRIDGDVLRVLLPSPATHIGVLGPRRRTEKLLATLVQEGVTLPNDLRRRLFSPVGLAIGAETPEEIALSIVAEAQAALARESAGFLRDRSGPVHALASRVAFAGGPALEAAE